MKIFTTGLMLLAAFAIPLYAQAKPVAKPAPAAAEVKPAPEAKPVPAPATTTVAMPAPQPASRGGNNAAIYEFWKGADLTVSAFGAFNYTTKSTFSQQVDTTLSNTGTYISPNFGATGWYGNNQSMIGLSAEYMQVYNNSVTVSSTTIQERLLYIPIIAYFRVNIMEGLWAAVGGGSAIGLLKVDTGTATNVTFVTPLASLRAGYDYKIMQGLSVGAFLDLRYSFAKVNQNITGTATDYSANALSILPGIAVNYTF